MSRGRRRKRTFGDVLRFLLMLVALAVFLYSAWMLYGFYREYKKSSDEYDNLESTYAVKPEEKAEDADVEEEDKPENLDLLEDDEVMADSEAVQSIAGREVKAVVENGKEVRLPTLKNPINFDELIKVNEDIVGWLRIRALDISYPVVQAEDNDYYLHRTFEKTDNFAGCLFLNCDNRDDFTNQNSIIYGHNMKNGSMFGKLKQFNDPEVFDKSRYFWIFTPDLIYQYRIFSASVVDKTGMTYQIAFSDEEFQELLQSALDRSVVDHTGIEVTTEDRIVTLSTCTGDSATRYVVIGKLSHVYASR